MIQKRCGYRKRRPGRGETNLKPQAGTGEAKTLGGTRECHAGEVDASAKRALQRKGNYGHGWKQAVKRRLSQPHTPPKPKP